MRAMPQRLIANLFAFAFLVAAAAGCKTETLTLSCDPPCAPGFSCDTTTGQCVTGGEMPDLTAGPPGDMAMGGCSPACAAPTPFCNPNKQCVACLADKDCPMGSVCKTTNLGASCQPGCTDDSRCANGQKCCNAQCVDPTKDVNNCGACGKACAANHARPTCAAGVCKAGSCDPGWGDCNNDGSDGCEANLHVDAKNCTACGMMCSIKNATAACSDGCYLKACLFGYDDCNGDAKDGCETSVVADPKNCGGCGKACPVPAHTKVACLTGSCAVTSCDLGYSDCNNNPADGCEVATGTDVKNCGGCGVACGNGLVCINSSCTCQNCNIPGAMSKCINNQCVFDKCLGGFADCNNNTNDGCEINTGTDAKNCGACGSVCPMGTPSCSNGACVVGFDFGPSHSFTGLTSTHYITQGGCSAGNGNIDVDAQYFCDHFYGTPLGLKCTPNKGGYKLAQTPNCNDAKMHKTGGCTSNGNNIPNTACDSGPCKIGNWTECTSGITNLICHCQ